MKKFIYSFIRLLITLIISIFLIFLCAILFIFILSRTNSIPVENIATYFVGTGDTSAALLGSSTTPANITLEDSSTDSISTTNNYCYYYTQLDDSSKIIYDSLNKNINNLKKENFIIDFSTTFNTLLNQDGGQEKLNTAFQSALDAFFYDHPELFYIDISKINLTTKYTKFGSKTTYKVSLTPNTNSNFLHDYFTSEAQVDSAISKVKNIKNSTIKTLSGKSDYQKALYVHDALVNSLKYDDSSINAHSLYGALVEKSAVCEGYAKAFKYILDDLNIDCILVSGKATDSKGNSDEHMWNYIKLNNNWYGVDPTWDDPIIYGSSKNTLRHDYFGKGSSTFNKSHSPNGRISSEGIIFKLPTLSSKNYK